MLTMNKSAFRWQEDRSWWDYNEDGRTVHLTDLAPDYAVESFKEYEKKYNNNSKKNRKAS